jgi:hypothetical protein
LGDIFGGIKGGIIKFVNLFSYFEMKERAGTDFFEDEWLKIFKDNLRLLESMHPSLRSVEDFLHLTILPSVIQCRADLYAPLFIRVSVGVPTPGSGMQEGGK